MGYGFFTVKFLMMWCHFLFSSRCAASTWRCRVTSCPRSRRTWIKTRAFDLTIKLFSLSEWVSGRNLSSQSRLCMTRSPEKRVSCQGDGCRPVIGRPCASCFPPTRPSEFNTWFVVCVTHDLFCWEAKRRASRKRVLSFTVFKSSKSVTCFL